MIKQRVFREDGYELPYIEGIGFVDDEPIRKMKRQKDAYKLGLLRRIRVLRK